MRSIYKIAAVMIFLAASIAAQSTWQTFKSADGKFSIDVPCELQKQSTPDSAGTTFTNHMCIVGTSFYSVMHEDVTVDISTAAAKTQFLDGMRGGFLKSLSTKSELVSEKKITFATFPGREIIVRWPDPSGPVFTAKGRFIIVGKRAYMLFASAMNPTSEPSDSVKYLDSLMFAR